MLYVPKDPLDLILRYLPDWAPSVFFDVGANVGQSAAAYARRFPDAVIHSFEPSPKAFLDLSVSVLGFPNVAPHRLALGREAGKLRLARSPRSGTRRLAPLGEDITERAVIVDVTTGADVMQSLDVDRIDFLKIDTEGHDLEVLHGFLPVIDRIDFIEVEAGMNPYNTLHVPFRQLEDLLRGNGFHLAHIFEQKMEWHKGGQLVLRRCNPLFVSGRLLDLPTRG
jgi:FkbM family methyltransferase